MSTSPGSSSTSSTSIGNDDSTGALTTSPRCARSRDSLLNGGRSGGVGAGGVGAGGVLGGLVHHVGHRQCETEQGAVAVLGIDPDAPAVVLHDLLRDGQPDA